MAVAVVEMVGGSGFGGVLYILEVEARAAIRVLVDDGDLDL